MIEYELKILDINVDETISKLKTSGYVPQPEKPFRRVIFDTHPVNANKWLRLRTDGQTTTLTYKNFKTDAIDGVEEIEVVVGDFDDCRQLLLLAGFHSTSYQENRRIDFVSPAGSAQVSIDTWPGIPAYMEVEGSSVDEVNAVVDSLGIRDYKQTSVTTKEIYKLYGLSIDGKQELRFEQTNET